MRGAGASPVALAVVLEALAFFGQAPPEALDPLLESALPALRAAAAGALARQPEAEGATGLDRALHSAEWQVRNRAVLAGIACGKRASVRRCLSVLQSPDEHAGPLLLPAAMLGSRALVERVIEALALPALRRDGLWSLGFAGTPEAVQACLAVVQAEAASACGRVAAEAICAITGLDLQQANLVAAPADDAEVSDAHDSVLPSDDEALPAAEADGLAQWWAEQAGRFVADTRYLGGEPLTLAGLQRALAQAPTRRRHAIALELAARSAGACQVQTRAFSGPQQRQMRALAGATGAALNETARGLGYRPIEVD